jgi:hypothetical protein
MAAQVIVTEMSLATAQAFPQVIVTEMSFATQNTSPTVVVTEMYLTVQGNSSTATDWARLNGAWVPILDQKRRVGGVWT